MRAAVMRPDRPHVPSLPRRGEGLIKALAAISTHAMILSEPKRA